MQRVTRDRSLRLIFPPSQENIGEAGWWAFFHIGENYSVGPLGAVRPLQLVAERLAQRQSPCGLPQPSGTAADLRIPWAGRCDPFFLRLEICGVLEVALHCYCRCVQQSGPFLWALGPQMCQHWA